MRIKRKFIGSVLLFSFCATSVVACNSKSSDVFESWKISEDGRLDWNDVKDAKYYYCSINGVESKIWTDKSELDVKEYFADKNTIKEFQISAYINKTELGRMLIEPIKDKFVFSNGKFYKYDDAPRYKVTMEYPGRYRKSQTYENVLSTEFSKYKSEVNLKYNAAVCYELKGLYYDSNFNKEVSEDIVLDSDLTIYANVKELIKTISFFYAIGDNSLDSAIEFGSISVYYTRTFCLNDIELPTFSGASFSHWNGIGNSKINENIWGYDADDEYIAVYYENA